jgi:dienelactone hydrolase
MISKILVVLVPMFLYAESSLPTFGQFHESTTKPAAPGEMLTAEDVAIQFNGATGAALDWLRLFDHPVTKFEYTLQLLSQDDEVTVYRLTYPSPFASPFEENNTVPAEYYVPTERSGKLPAAVVLDILQGNALVARSMARGLAAQGVAALYVPMAYYGARRPKDKGYQLWLEADPARAVQPPRQTVMDIRRAKAILASRPEIDSQRIGITGVSLGGIVTSLAAGIDGTFYRVVPILAGGDLAEMMFAAPELRKLRQRLLARGIDRAKLEPIMAPVEPLNFASRIDPSRCLLINADKDEVIPKDCTTALWNAIGKPTLLWLPSGHYGAAWYLPTIRQTAVDFLKGKKVEKLEY